MHLPILPAILLGLMTLGTPATAAQPEFPYAAGTDAAGRAQAVSDAAGRVLVESPEFPRGLWVDLVDGAGKALEGIEVEYQGRADSLVVIWSVDPSGLRQETLLWKRPAGDPLRLTLKAADPAQLPAGLASIDWRIDPDGEGPLMLDPVDGPLLAGWGDLRAFLQERWQGRTGRVAVQVDSTALAVDLAHPEAVDRFVDYFQDQSRRSLGEARAPLVQVLLSPYAFDRSLALLADSIVLNAYVVLVPGSELEQWALWSLSRSSGPVTLSEAAALTTLVARGRDIVDVGPLAALIGLRVLNLDSNEIVDVGPLAALIGLEVLNLRDNQIVDVGPLADLINLESLRLSHNEIVDVGPLAALTNLDSLDLQGNAIVDVGPLASLTDLESLDLGYYNEIVDVSPLVALTGLEELDLSGNDIVDVSPLASLASLERLDLQSNPVDLSSLATLTNLRELGLGWNQIVDVSPLAALTGLEKLDLSGNWIVDVSPLAALPSLKQLDLVHQYGPDDRPTLDMGSLAALTGLEGLILTESELLDVGPLAALTSLKWLFLDRNYIADVTPLAALTKLEFLCLEWNWIEDISPLAALTSLVELSLDLNLIVDVGPLASLTNLWWLDLEHNEIQDIGPLVANPGLAEGDWVQLGGNPLSDQAINEQIPALEARGVRVSY